MLSCQIILNFFNVCFRLGSPTPDFQLGRTPTTTSSPTVAPSSSTPLQARSAVYGSGQGIAKDPPSGSDVDAELEEELNKISLGESSISEPPLLVVPTPEQTPPPITKITPPPGESENQADQVIDSTEIPGSSCSTQANQFGEATATVTTVKEVQIELIEQGSGVQTEPDSPPTIKVLVLEATTPVSAETAAADPGENLAKMATASNTTTITTDDQAMRADDDAERAAEIEQTVLDELSPTTDEYQEFGDAKDAVDDFDSIDIGYIPPAPTPAPSMAPLAELDVDTVDDEPCEPAAPPPSHSAPASSSSRELVMASGSVTATPTSSNEEARKRRKKRNSEGKKLSSQDDKDKDAHERAGGSSMDAADHNAVCPWEDELV